LARRWRRPGAGWSICRPTRPSRNPIEQVFAKLKAHLRAAASRTGNTLVAAIGAGFDAVTPADIAGCYRHGGYRLPNPVTQPL
jgi:transposase